MGVDFGENCIIWSGWQPGEDCVKYIRLKNITLAAIRIEYCLPRTSFFYMEFPQPIDIYPGMTAKLRVSFRPIRLEPYRDVVTFSTKKGEKFVLHLKANVPALVVELPTSIDLGNCAVKETAQSSCTVRNTGGMKATLKWTSNHSDLLFKPNNIAVNPGKEINFAIQYTAQQAERLKVRSVCTVKGAHGGEVHVKSMICTAVSKYPYISLATSAKIDLGDVPIGSIVQRRVTLRNACAVSTLIQCTAVVPGSKVGRPSHLKDPGPGLPPAFIITPGQYLVPPHSSFSFTLEYRARFSGNRDIEVFKFRTEGGNEQQMSVCAQAFGPWVVPCTESINFGDVTAGQNKTLVLDLRNDSDMDGDFHILGEREDYA